MRPHAVVSPLQRGFTLLELLIVLTIGALVAMMAIPNINYPAIRVNAAAKQVDMALLGAQRLAVLRQYSVVVAFDTANQQLRVHEDRNSNGVLDAGEITNYVKLEEGVAFGRGSVPAFATLGANEITFKKTQTGLPAITFTREGATGEAGGFYITSKRALQNGAFNKESKAFEINRGTGRTMVYGYDGTSWKRSF